MHDILCWGYSVHAMFWYLVTMLLLCTSRAMSTTNRRSTLYTRVMDDSARALCAPHLTPSPFYWEYRYFATIMSVLCRTFFCCSPGPSRPNHVSGYTSLAASCRSGCVRRRPQLTTNPALVLNHTYFPPISRVYVISLPPSRVPHRIPTCSITAG